MSSGGSSGRSSERWSGLERRLSPRRTQVLLLSALAVAFVLFRWLQRLEPWNSDDMQLFQLAVDAASGHHWVFRSVAGSVEPAGSVIPHAAFRIGLLPVALPAIKALGASATAYYLVPLLFSLLGFCALYWVMLTTFGPLVALVLAVIHVAWPFELEHASLFLTDLPSAATALVSLCLLDAAPRQPARNLVACALLAGLAAVESCLLRSNALVLLAPAYLVFLCFRSTRIPTLWASAVIVLGVLAQQGFQVYRGFPWGFDWQSARAAFPAYAPFLPVFTWQAFLVRQFRYQFVAFGHGGTGLLAALLVAGSLFLHLLLLRYERRVLLVAISAFGLFTWLLFSFSIYELVPGGVRAMLPVNFRYIQPFTYSSLVIWAWAWCALRKRHTPAWQRASLVLPSLLIAFSYTASVLHLAPTYREGEIQPLVGAIQERLIRADEPEHVLGTEPSLRVARLFCCTGSSRHVEWRELSPSELAETVEHGSRALVLRDIPRELGMARYLAPEARRAYREELSRLEERLWRGYELTHLDTSYALFGPPRSPQVPADDVLQTPSAEPAGIPLLRAAACNERPSSGDGSRTLVPRRDGSKRAFCEFTRLTDGLVLTAPEPPRGSSFVLRLNAEFESPLSVSVELVESGEHGVRRRESRIEAGTSYLPVPPQPGTQSLFVVYRVHTNGALGTETVQVRPTEWRRHRFSVD